MQFQVGLDQGISYESQAWKKYLFPCRLGKISLQQGRIPSSV